jgi:hypothetical protein
MRSKTATTVTGAASFVLLLVTSAHAKLVCDRVVDDFKSSAPGSFPKGWQTKDQDEMPFAKAKHLYMVEQHGNRRVLHATYREQAITIGRRIENWNLDEYPVLEWQWKAIQLPKGGNENSLGNNDCGAAVYAIWDIGFPFYVDSLKYSWSSTLPVGKHVSKRLGHDHVLVTESGAKRVGQWQTVRVDVRRDHQRFFGKEARKPRGIALLSDADATNSSAEAYYADFKLCRQL